MAARRTTSGHAGGLELYQRVLSHLNTPGVLPPKWNPEIRPMKGLAVPMIMIVTAQVLREAMADPASATAGSTTTSTRSARLHAPELDVLETVGPNGEFLDHFDGRTLNPGHAIEAAWFILQRGTVSRQRSRAAQTGLTILDWMWERGWDGSTAASPTSST